MTGGDANTWDAAVFRLKQHGDTALVDFPTSVCPSSHLLGVDATTEGSASHVVHTHHFAYRGVVCGNRLGLRCWTVLVLVIFL